MSYIYHGEIQIYQNDLDRFLEIAERLRLEGLIGGGKQHEDDGKTEPIVEVKVSTPLHNVVVSNSEDKTTRYARKAEKVMSVQASDIQSLEDLDQRVEESYTKVSPGYYTCNVCDKSFKQKSNAQEHVEIHIEGLSFPCKFCDAILRSRNSLRLHSKRQH